MEHSLNFFGNELAEKFSQIVNTSFNDMERFLLVRDKNDPLYGYCYQALPGFGGRNSMWCRDMGTLIRELALYGHLDSACALSSCLMDRVGLNEDGYYTFPRFFTQTEYGKSGDELDGTGAIVIGLILLWERLSDDCPTRRKIRDFLECKASPIRWILSKLKDKKLIEGTGEFGSGYTIESPSCNAVQNNLVRLSLIGGADFFAAIGEKTLSDECRKASEIIEENICRYLIKDGKLVWCVDPETLEPDPEIIGAEINRGTTFINGVYVMSEDILGLGFTKEDTPLYRAGEQTFDDLMERPLRKALFEKYGMYQQFDDFWKGFTGPAYGHGYAMQFAALTGRRDLLNRLLGYFVDYTINPDPVPNKLVRESPYWIYERYYVPEALDFGTVPEASCGPLTIVCVTEILKVARLIAGIDHVTGEIKPTLPEGWNGFSAKGFPMLKDGKTVMCDIEYRVDGGKVSLEVKHQPSGATLQ